MNHANSESSNGLEAKGHEGTPARQALPVSLFSDASIWETEPHVGFDSLLLSEEFRVSNQSSRKLPESHKIKDQTVVVYRSMFNKFCKHLELHRCSFVQASPGIVNHFMNGELDNASSETRGRYIRLLERVYQFLEANKVVASNPVTAWKIEMLETNRQAVKVVRATPDWVGADTIVRLQAWLKLRGQREIAGANWRAGRDMTLASLSLGTGMRCAELIKLNRSRVKYEPLNPRSERFSINLPTLASVATAKAHEVALRRDCVDLFEAWWDSRWNGFGRGEVDRQPLVIDGEIVFPPTSTPKGESTMSEATLYKNLKEICKEAVAAGVLDESSKWVLERGAQGLRRAYVLSELERGAAPTDLKTRLGIHDIRSVHRYIEGNPRVSDVIE